MHLEMAGKTDVGRQRARNEDHFLVLQNVSMTAVADGMGGHVDGNIASQIAVDTLMEEYQNEYEASLEEDRSTEDLLKWQEDFLAKSIQKANKNIFAKNQGNFALEGMGTTIVALQISSGYAITACVGDSRIYLFRENKLVQLTQDHSLVGELLRYKIIAEKDLLFLQNKNIITRALGMAEQVIVDTSRHKILPGDLLLLCSDGLSDFVEHESILQILQQDFQHIEEPLKALIDKANEAGGQDNITVSIVKMID